MDPLTGTLLIAVAKAAGTAAGKEAAQFVLPLIGLVNAQTRVLNEIRRVTTVLIEAPYVTAKTPMRRNEPHIQGEVVDTVQRVRGD